VLNSDVRDETACDGTDPLLAAWYDGELDGERAASVAAHVAACPACAGQVAAFRAVDEALGEVATPLPAADLVDAVLAGVQRERRWELARHLAAAAVILLATGLGLLAGAVATRPRAEARRPVLVATLDSVTEAFAPAPSGGLGALTGELTAVAEGRTP
jgi:anti-sigma factor RsiW